jgi:hypothetical protein
VPASRSVGGLATALASCCAAGGVQATPASALKIVGTAAIWSAGMPRVRLRLWLTALRVPSLQFIQAMDQIDPTSRQRLIRNIFVLVAQFLSDRMERFVARHAQPRSSSADTRPRKPPIFLGSKMSPSRRQLRRPEGRDLQQQRALRPYVPGKCIKSYSF